MTDNQVKVALEKFKPDLPIGANGDIVSDSGIMLRPKLEAAREDCMDELMQIKLKSRVVTILLAIFLGGIGAARFYLGDIKLGILRIVGTIATALLSFVPILSIIASIASFIWVIAEIYFTYKHTKQVNFVIVSDFLYYNRENR